MYHGFSKLCQMFVSLWKFTKSAIPGMGKKEKIRNGAIHSSAKA